MVRLSLSMALIVPRSFTASSSAKAGLALRAFAILGSNHSTSQNTAIVPIARVTIVTATARMSFTIASPFHATCVPIAPSLNVRNAERLRDGTLGLVRDQRPTRTKVPWATLLRRTLPPGLLQVLRPDEDLARLGALAGAAMSINPVLLHHVDEARGLRIARHRHAPIHVGSSRLSFVCREVDAWPRGDFGARS